MDGDNIKEAINEKDYIFINSNTNFKFTSSNIVRIKGTESDLVDIAISYAAGYLTAIKKKVGVKTRIILERH